MFQFNHDDISLFRYQLGQFKNSLFEARFFPIDKRPMRFGCIMNGKCGHGQGVQMTGCLSLLQMGRSLKWMYMEYIFSTSILVIHEIDVISGLSNFMLTAAGLARLPSST